MPPKKLTEEELKRILTASPLPEDFEVTPDSLLLGGLVSVDRKSLANIMTEEHYAPVRSCAAKARAAT